MDVSGTLFVRRTKSRGFMDERDAWRAKLLGATERALERTHLTDPDLYLELLEVYAQLQRQAARAATDARLSRAGGDEPAYPLEPLTRLWGHRTRPSPSSSVTGRSRGNPRRSSGQSLPSAETTTP